MPRKVFVAGEILTAADMNEYVGDQVIMTFAGTAARGSAIGTAVEGMVTYLEDSDSFEYWDGSAWDELTLPVSTTSPVSGDSLVYDGSNWVNGPRSGNAIINGDFGIWQRGTSFSSNEYTADRWRFDLSGATATVSRQSFTPADIEAIGYGDAEYFLRVDSSGGSTLQSRLRHRVENVRTLAGQQVTLSFWAKMNAANTIKVVYFQNFGSGGSSAVFSLQQDINLTTDWARYSLTFDVDSVAGKTIGANSYNQLEIRNDEDESFTLDVWGVQLEAGPVATPFKLAGGGSKAAELALCQRYYFKYGDTGEANQPFGSGYANSTTQAIIFTHFPVTMRTRPTALEQTGTGSDYEIVQATNSIAVCSSVPTYVNATVNGAYHFFNGLTGLTAGEGLMARSDNGYLAWDSEL